MKKGKRKKLEKAGWKVGSTEDFLGLTDEDSRYVELRLALSDAVRAQRASSGLTQEELARRLGSSQSRVSKLEKADPTVTLDLLIRSMLAAGATSRDIASAIASTGKQGRRARRANR